MPTGFDALPQILVLIHRLWSPHTGFGPLHQVMVSTGYDALPQVWVLTPTGFGALPQVMVLAHRFNLRQSFLERGSVKRL